MDFDDLKRRSEVYIKQNKTNVYGIMFLYFICILIKSILSGFFVEVNFNPDFNFFQKHIIAENFMNLILFIVSIPLLMHLFSGFSDEMLSFKRKFINWKLLFKGVCIGLALFILQIPFIFVEYIHTWHPEIFYWVFEVRTFDNIIIINNILSLLVTLLFSYTLFISVIRPEKSVIYCFKKSIELFFNYFYKILRFEVSFFLWFLLLFAIYYFTIIFKENLYLNQFLNLSVIFSIPISLGIGIYFFPYYCFSKLQMCRNFIETQKFEICKEHKIFNIKRKYILFLYAISMILGSCMFVPLKFRAENQPLRLAFGSLFNTNINWGLFAIIFSSVTAIFVLLFVFAKRHSEIL